MGAIAGRQLWYWPAGPRGHPEASAVIVERDGRIRPVTLAALAAELGCDRSDGETGQRGGTACALRLADGVGLGAETLPSISRRVALSGDCKLGWGRGGSGVPVPHNDAGPAKGDECDEQRGEVEFRVHFKHPGWRR
jgi:hypothetical protein